MIAQERKFPKAKHRIIEAMLVLLSKKEFDDISINDICRQADVSRSTFYRHFEDKYDLVMQWLNHLILQSADVYTDASVNDYFNKLVSTVYALQHCETPLKPLISRDGNKELQWRIYNRSIESIAEYYRELLKCEASSKIPEMLAVFVCVGIAETINWVVQNNFPVPKETLISYLVHITQQNPLFLSS